jgi:hypothetical protein
MKLDNEDIGGKEVGAAGIDITCPLLYGDRYIGLARTLLGNMKREMYLGGIRHMKRSYDMKPIIFETTLGDLIANGGFEGMVLDSQLTDVSYIEMPVKVQVYPWIRISSIRDEV